MDSPSSQKSELFRQSNIGSTNGSPDEDTYEVVQYPREKLLELATTFLQLCGLPDDSLGRSDTNCQDLSCVRWLVNHDVLEHLPANSSIAYSALASNAEIPEKQLRDVVRTAILGGFLREPTAGHIAHSRSSALLMFYKNFLSQLRWTSNIPMTLFQEIAHTSLFSGETGVRNKTTANASLDTTDSFPCYIKSNESLAAVVSDVEPPLIPATNERPILIIGAGVSGLCLAQALRKVNIPFRVFERDSAIDSRPQGYRLKLREEAEVALLESLPKDVYQRFLSSCAILSVGETDFNPFTGEVTKSRAGGGLSGNLGLCPSHTVDRTVLRSILMMGIADRVHFSKQLANYNLNSEQGNVTATFVDGERVEGRFLVGADGLHSMVRPGLLPEHKIKDTGAACIYGKTPLTTTFTNKFPEKGLRWMTIVSDQAPLLQSCHIGDAPVTLLTEPTRFSKESRSKHQLPEDYVYWVLIAPRARFYLDGESSVSKAGGLNPQQAATEAARLSLSVTQEWHPSLRSVFELQDMQQATFVRIISSTPDISTWEPSAMVTLLGDAIHPMSPCGGVGAQTAICDAASLAKTMAETRGNPTAKEIAAFEEGMRKRAHRSIVQSEFGSKRMFGLGSLEECKPWNGC